MTRLVIIGGSDAGISAALRARELDPECHVDVVLADAYPNYSICGIPYHVSGEVPDWRNLAHRTIADLEQTGMRLHLDTVAETIDVDGHSLVVRNADSKSRLSYDKLIVGTGAVSVRPPIAGLEADMDGVYLLHTIGDTRRIMEFLARRKPATALIVGAGYIGLEMAEGLTARGITVTQMEQLPEVLPTVDSALGALVRDELTQHGVDVRAGTVVRAIAADRSGSLSVTTTGPSGEDGQHQFELVLVVVGVRPDSAIAAQAGATLAAKQTINVDRQMRTNLPDVFAAGDCVVTHHRQLGETYLPLGTTAHKQGRIAGENALGASREFEGSLGTQVVKVFDHAVARTGLRDHEAMAAGHDAFTIAAQADDHKAYYPGSRRIHMRLTGDRTTGQLLGVQLFGHRHSEIAKRIDVAATAIYYGTPVEGLSDLDLSYTPPLGSPWDALQTAAQSWVRHCGTTVPPRR